MDEWIFFDGHSLIGVPVRAEEQPEKVQIVLNNETKINCKVLISENLIHYYSNESLILNKIKNEKVLSLKCTSFEQVTVFVINISENLLGHSRFRIFKNICSLLQHGGFSCDSIVFEEPNKNLTTSVLQTNIHVNGKHYDVTNVWWPVSCSSDSLNSGALRSIKTIVENGTLSRDLGVKVAGWSIANRGDDKARYAANSLHSSVIKSSQ